MTVLGEEEEGSLTRVAGSDDLGVEGATTGSTLGAGTGVGADLGSTTACGGVGRTYESAGRPAGAEAPAVVAGCEIPAAARCGGS